MEQRKKELAPELEGFKQLVAWQKAYGLTLAVYRVTQGFPRAEVYGLTSQMQRAAVSVPANIAEGYGRQHRKEYVQFLFLARGSLSELETYILLAKDLRYLDEMTFADLARQRREVGRTLGGLIKSLSTND